MRGKRIMLFLLVLALLGTWAAPGWTQPADKPAPSAPGAAPAQAVAPAKAVEATPSAKTTGPPEDKKKHTVANLYVTSKEAYAMWQADQANVKILDCRTPGEYAFVGHAPHGHQCPGEILEIQMGPRKKRVSDDGKSQIPGGCPEAV